MNHSVDPIKDTLPEDPIAGFLPPNDSIGSGQGSVSFSINLKNGIDNGESISNRASIVFDNNDPIVTPTWTNKKDIIAPSSMMLPVVLKSDTTITLSWQGQDDPDGSGVYCYSLYVKKGTGEYEPVLNRACQNSIEYKFQEDVQYSFYVIASDSANNTELKSIVPDITFYRNTHGINDIRTTGNDLLKTYPNPSTKRAGITLEVALPNESLLSAEIIITSANGTVVKSLDHLERKMHIAGIPEGVYFINLFLNQKALESKKIILE
ncbi:T9SS type A sorting domain-containing protein [Candidatus Nomurabacteria bacterium]|nr:T9SS type A sorting domain-containing protein [Candidatus Nomurabacteria bacterium]